MVKIILDGVTQGTTSSSGGSGSATWIGLTDTPSSITASHYVIGNTGGTALTMTEQPPASAGDFDFGTVTSPTGVINLDNGSII